MAKDIEPCRADTTINGYDGIIHNHIRPALYNMKNLSTGYGENPIFI